MKIVVTGNLLRRNPQEANTNTLYHLIAKQIVDLTGVTPILHNKQTPISDAEFLATERPAPYSRKPSSIFNDNPKSALWISFEGNRRFIHQLIEQGAPFIDVHIHPYRFCDDLILGIKSNIDFSGYKITDQYVQQCVQIMRSGMSHFPSIGCEDRSIMLVGQTPTDTSVIHRGRYTNLTHFKAEIVKESEGFDEIIYKPHPFNQDDNLNLMMELFHEKKKYQIITNEINTYALLTSQKIKKVIGISSSVIEEARAFGLEATSFIPIRTAQTIPVHPKEFLSYDFWRYALAKQFKITNNIHNTSFWRPNLLRDLWRAKWSYPY